MAQTKIPVFLGIDPMGSHGPYEAIAVAYLDEETGLTITIEAAKLKEKLDQLIEVGQIRGLALNVAYMAPTVKKENDNAGT